ncbi:MAG: RNA 2',3'-cyclic phosphodiesterase [Candidatus Korobacteraceae bacterium]|jgi:2'-5' RNA ligase
MRLFVALDIDADIRRRITEFREQMRPLAPDVRWVDPETFHITLQFLGETNKLDEIQRALQSVRAARIELGLRNAGFFPSPRSPRVFWVGIEADQNLQGLVNSIGQALQPLGLQRDAGPFKPHLTLARSGSRRPRPEPGERSAPALQQVRVKLETLGPLEFGTMTAHEFYLYESKLSPAGARYTKLSRYPLE